MKWKHVAIVAVLWWPAVGLVDVLQGGVSATGEPYPWWLPLAVLVIIGIPAALSYMAGWERAASQHRKLPKRG